MSSGSERQVTQMVNFINQEADEKVREILAKAEHDATLERQNISNIGKERVIEEYVQKKKDLVVLQRKAASSANSEARVRKWRSRDTLLDELKANVTRELTQFSRSEQYPGFVKQLIIQGLIKMQEDVIEIQCRPADNAMVSRMLGEVRTEYETLMRGAGHTDFTVPTVSLSALHLNDKTCNGGVVLCAKGGRIILDQTVDERLNIAYHGLMPQVRAHLFP